jgi:hypothetical protein
MKLQGCFGGAACAGLALVAVLGVVKPAQADTIVNDFTVDGIASPGALGIASSSFARFDPTIGALTGVTLSFAGTADLTVTGDLPFADFESVSPASNVHQNLFIGLGSQRDAGSFSISANGTITDDFDAFEGSGTQALEFVFGVDNAVVTVNGQSGTLTYEYTPTSPAVPEPSTWAMMLVGFAGLGYAGYRRRTIVAAA